MFVAIAGRGCRYPAIIYLSPPLRGRVKALPLLSLNGLIVFPPLNQLAKDSSVFLAGRELSSAAAVGFPALSELVCLAVHDTGDVLPTEHWRQRKCWEKRFWRPEKKRLFFFKKYI